MVLHDYTFPQNGDTNYAQSFAMLGSQDHNTDYVASGLGLTPDFANNSLDIGDGVCYLSQPADSVTDNGVTYTFENQAYVVQYNSRTISIPSSGQEYVVAEANLGTTDAPQIQTYSDPTNAPAASLVLGLVDADAETVDERNRYPDAHFQSITVEETRDLDENSVGEFELDTSENVSWSGTQTFVTVSADDVSTSTASVSTAPSANTDVVRKTELDSVESSVSSLSSNKLDKSNYTPESDTHTKYTDSEARDAVTGNTDIVDLSGAKASADQVVVSDGTDLSYTDIDNLTASAPIDSVFGRTGDVTAQDGDYSHSQLSGVSSNDHHSRYTDSEAASAAPVQDVNGETGNVSLSHSDINSVSSNDHHSRYTNTEARAAVEGTTDLVDLSGAKGNSNEVVVTDGSSLSYTDISNVGSDSPVDSVFGRTGAVTAQSGDYSHSQLSGVSSNDHHSRYSDSEASSAAPVQDVNGQTGSVNINTFSGSHNDLYNVGSSDHHSRYTDSEARSAVNTFSGSHNDLYNVGSNDHHSRYTDSEAVGAMTNANIDPSQVNQDTIILNGGDSAEDWKIQDTGSGIEFNDTGGNGPYITITDGGTLDASNNGISVGDLPINGQKDDGYIIPDIQCIFGEWEVMDDQGNRTTIS